MIGLLIALAVIFVLFIIFILPGFKTIGANEVGILVRKIGGGGLPQGRIVALKGENGIQAETLMPGLYWKFPMFWNIRKVPVTVINPDSVGIVEAIDGMPLPSTRLLGDRVECNAFQDARAFMNNKGSRGPQVDILRPGTYRINTLLFKIKPVAATTIDEQRIGVVTALDGLPLPSGYIIAPKADTSEMDHKYFQDGQAFINGSGYRGTQLDTLQPGRYYINPLLFDVVIYKTSEVPPGYVAVIRSNVGIMLDRSPEGPEALAGEGPLKGPIHADVEKLLITDRQTRGIWKDPVAPGVYNLNTIAYTPYLVPTSAVTIDWAGEGKIGTNVKGADNEGVLYKFDPLKVTSKDGFLLAVNVRMVIRIQAANAAYIIARFGSVPNLIDQIVHPLIDSSFRNKAGEKKAIDFFQSRTDLQSEALAHAKEKFGEYNVEAQNLLIAYIDIPPALLDTQTMKEIALQQQTQFAEQAKAQTSRIEVEEKTARANKQKDVIDAKLSIDISKDKASARMAEAEGEASYIQKTSAAEGMGKAEGYKAQKDALGSEGTALVNIITALADKGLKFVPEVVVGSGGGSSGLSDLIGVLMAKYGKELGNNQPQK